MAKTVKVNKKGRIFEVDYAVILWRKRRKKAELQAAKERAKLEQESQPLTRIKNIFE